MSGARKQSDVAYIYVYGVPGGPSKIGHSMDAERRLKDIEREKNCKLVVTGIWDVGLAKALAVERYIHWLLRDRHIRSEWFDATDEEILAAVNKALTTGLDHRYVIPARDAPGRELRFAEHIATKFPRGTKDRIQLALVQGETHADFIREAVEKELLRLEQTPRRPEPGKA